MFKFSFSRPSSTSRHSSRMISACALLPLTMRTKSSAYRQLSHRRFPLPALPEGSTTLIIDTAVPVPAVLAGLLAKAALFQIPIELIQHDVCRQRGDDTTLWHTSSAARNNPESTWPALMIHQSKDRDRWSLIRRRAAFMSRQ